MKYSIEEIEKLRNIRLPELDDEYSDEIGLDTEHGIFESETDKFINWLKKMEKQNKIQHLLQFYNIFTFKENEQINQTT